MTLTAPIGLGCVAHRVHLPAPTYLELHHVIPQAWQKFWWPPPGSGFLPPAGTPWASLPDDKREGVALWDPRTVALCRTGHGNVHYWLVWMMKNYKDGIPKIPLTEKYVRKEAAIARQAMERWIAAGGDIEALRAHKLWGQI